ncbi:MAG: AMP-binding protein [Agathobacter sp.]|uniref:AMP-binding protein n=1 Tax=Agathobacter sp. TaxID=2021311 RepID=UPI002E76C268|nr:AMP-binding protein [Agathobacter sp.]MEE1216861.1 AMP-binding protein [Agathobacter sp.]
MKNVLEWLEATVTKYSDKPAFSDTESSITFAQVYDIARNTGAYLIEKLGVDRTPVAVFAGRKMVTPAYFLGVVYAGRPYAPIDASLPDKRIEKILENLCPRAIVADRESLEHVESIVDELAKAEGFERPQIFVAEDISRFEWIVGADGNCKISESTGGAVPGCEEETDDIAAENENDTDDGVVAGCVGKTHDSSLEKLAAVRRQMSMTDPLYIIYTSGSTGNPKGVMTSHLSLMTYINAYCDVMHIEGDDVLGNQSPLDYIAAIRDIYLPLKTGCSTVIIPKEYFMEPNALFDYMNEKKVSSVGWSVSAFTILTSLGAFEETELKSLRKICFSGSVMPCRVLRKWQENLPEAHFVNQYGPTEATASCTYYIVDHTVEEDEVLPIGQAYDNYRVFLIDEHGNEPAVGEQGEICVCGPILALGYYNDWKRTDAAFTLNPLNKAYPDRMYRTGDYGRLDEDGILHFCGRMDRQIKHMGHRVELDEVEHAANVVEGVAESCVIYNKAKEVLILFYTGDCDRRSLALALRDELPGFMVPRKIKKLEQLPKLPNGKYDMKKLEEM